MKKMISIALVFSMLFIMTVPTFATERTDMASVSADEFEAVTNPDEETMFAQMMAQLPSDEEDLLADGLIGEESLGKQVFVDNDNRATNATSYYYETLNMPGAMFYIVTLGWKNNNYTSATYNGHGCFKFVKDNIIVYVNKNAFYPATSATYDKSNKHPSDGTISGYVTQYLNYGETSFYYSGYWRVFNADGLPYVQLVVYGTQAFKFEEDEIVMQHKVIASAGPSASSNMFAPKYPTLKLAIKNTGSGNRYLGGYYVKGVGDNTSISDIAPLIQLGYKAAKLASGAIVTGLTIDDVASILDIAVSLNKSGAFSKTYLSDTVPLSNEAKRVYAYSCSLTSPYALSSDGNYFQTHVGLNGADGSSLDYVVTVSSSSSR